MKNLITGFWYQNYIVIFTTYIFEIDIVYCFLFYTI